MSNRGAEQEFNPKETALKWFPMEINESNPTFQDFRALIQVASNHETRVLFYIWPLDQEYFETLGILDRSLLDRSKRLFRDAIEGEGIYLLDLSSLLAHEYFADILGHCTLDGRRKVAEALAPKVLEIVKDDSSMLE